MINQEVIFIFLLLNCAVVLKAANITTSNSMGNTLTTPNSSQRTSFDPTSAGNLNTSMKYTPSPSTSFNVTAVDDIGPVNSSTFYLKPNSTFVFSTQPMTSMVITTSMVINTHISPMSSNNVSVTVISGAVTGKLSTSSTFYPKPNGTRAISTQPMTSIATAKKEVLAIEASLIFTKETFHVDLNDKQSLRFFIMKKKVVEDIETAYEDIGKLLSVSINSFKNGSIVCVALLFFQNSKSTYLPNLKNILKYYGENTGKFELSAFKSYNESSIDEDVDDDDDDDDVILGLNWWQVGVIIAGIFVFIFLLIIIVLCCKISKINKETQRQNHKFQDEPTYVLSRPLYDSVDENEEMKVLGTTPTVVADKGAASVDGNPLSGQQEVSMHSSQTFTDGTNDSPVNETTSEVGKENPGTDVNEDDYVTVTDADAGSDEGVVRL